MIMIIFEDRSVICHIKAKINTMNNWNHNKNRYTAIVIENIIKTINLQPIM